MILTSTDARVAVDAVLDTFYAERIARAAASGGQYELLWRRMRNASRGGKRLRPGLVLLAHTALGGDAPEDALTAAAATELLHTALLFHDDVLDADLVRRGEPNLQGHFVADALESGLGGEHSRTWGDTAGVLGGDLLISAVHAFASRINSPARVEIHEILDESMFVTAAGELADVGYGVGAMHPEAAGIGRMMADKTAHYTFSAPMRIGAALAGASAEASADLSQIGAALGFIYQLRDDVLGVFGDPETIGKSIDGDLREGKRTLLIAHAEHSAEWADVRHLFGRRTSDASDIARLREAILDSGAAAEIERLLIHEGDQVAARIDASSLPAPLRQELRSIARRCAERES